MRAGVVLVVGLLLTGCSSPSEPTPSDDDGFGAKVTTAIITAEHNGASDAQLAILQDAQAAGVLEFEPYKQAIDATFECFDAHGLEYHTTGTDNSLGFPYIDYIVEGPESGPLPEATACEQENSAFVWELYQVQPASTEATANAFIAALPILIPCLREEGLLPAGGEPTADDVHEAIWAGFDSIEDGSAPDGFDPTRCISLAGIGGGF